MILIINRLQWMELLTTKAVSNVPMEGVWSAHLTTLHMRVASTASTTIPNSSRKKETWASLRVTMKRMQWMTMSLSEKLLQKHDMQKNNDSIVPQIVQYSLCPPCCCCLHTLHGIFPCSPNAFCLHNRWKTKYVVEACGFICLFWVFIASLWMLRWEAKTYLVVFPYLLHSHLPPSWKT